MQSIQSITYKSQVDPHILASPARKILEIVQDSRCPILNSLGKTLLRHPARSTHTALSQFHWTQYVTLANLLPDAMGSYCDVGLGYKIGAHSATIRDVVSRTIFTVSNVNIRFC